jgi:uncharacterized protein YdhG (YjbR/CyaY superfamily)
MAKTDFKSVTAYIASQPKTVQPVLKRLRAIIQKALPGADEVISYQIPAYKLHGRTVIYFAGFKEHYSLYPVNDRMATAFGDKFAPYELSGKGTIRFPISKPIPVELIGSIAKFRAKAVAERDKPATQARK